MLWCEGGCWGLILRILYKYTLVLAERFRNVGGVVMLWGCQETRCQVSILSVCQSQSILDFSETFDCIIANVAALYIHLHSK